MADTGPRGTAFSDPVLVPWRHARDGGNVSPPLFWLGASGGAAELLLLCEDPDAGQSSPGGRVRANGWGERGWGVPHPPAGNEARHCFFRLYSLPEPVPLPDGATADHVHRAVDAARPAGGTVVGMCQH